MQYDSYRDDFFDDRDDRFGDRPRSDEDRSHSSPQELYDMMLADFERGIIMSEEAEAMAIATRKLLESEAAAFRAQNLHAATEFPISAGAFQNIIREASEVGAGLARAIEMLRELGPPPRKDEHSPPSESLP